MTKDQILWTKAQPTPDSVTMNGAKQAMDEWAKQQAIPFALWIWESRILGGDVETQCGAWFYDNGELAAKNTGELYDLFIKQTAV